MDTAHHLQHHADLPTKPDALFKRLDDLDILYTTWHHPAFFTVEEGLEFEKDIPGLHCRNLFVRDKRETMFLVSAANETKIDLKKLSALLACGRLSFGSPERLWANLGVRPGSVCPYAIINDTAGAVTMVLDDTIMHATTVNFHPMVNTMTIGVAPQDLVRFIESTGHTPLILDLGPCAPEGE